MGADLGPRYPVSETDKAAYSRRKAALYDALALAHADYIAALLREQKHHPDPEVGHALKAHVTKARGEQADFLREATHLKLGRG